MSRTSINYEKIKELVGCPYKIHGRTKEGFDCYGIDIEVYKIHGMYLPDVDYDNPEQYESVFLEMIQKVKYEKLAYPQELCIIVIKIINEPTHTGVYLEHGLFIHATKEGVKIEPLHRWENRIEGYYKPSNC
ncbi:NlpC/P60 family protein [Treponema bryantii]|uniref:NlpC/P60 family protein n=1 Tax=Treponema bryantii TaxID=163 RepID=A0A1H9ATU7_9SPIR|nr:NlpC/P60 family protein [Treponema bryantii]SEP79813.1 NlpC/P60 family protein [Treponema bryantii]